MGVSPRRLGGWEPRELTEYVYDDAGKLVRTVTRREPEFSYRDKAALVAYRAHRLSIGEYGENVAEAMSGEADPARKNRKFWYAAVGPRINWAVHEVERAKEAYAKKHPDAPTHGVRWSVRRVDNPTYEPQQSPNGQ